MLAERMELLTKRPQETLFPPAQNRAAWEARPLTTAWTWKRSLPSGAVRRTRCCC